MPLRMRPHPDSPTAHASEAPIRKLNTPLFLSGPITSLWSHGQVLFKASLVTRTKYIPSDIYKGPPIGVYVGMY